MDKEFNYANEFNKIDLKELKKEIYTADDRFKRVVAS